MRLVPVINRNIDDILENNQDIKNFRSKKILITGATGYIGSYLIHTLLKDAENSNSDTTIYALVRSKERAQSLYKEYDSERIVYVEQDVREAITITEDVDYLIHCASNAAPKEYDTDPVGTMNTNFTGTDNLLKYARDHVKERFLYVSTIEMYGLFTDKTTPIKENEYGIMDACNPRSCYPLSKKACETLCISYAKQYGVPVSIGRLAYIYGPGMKENDSKIAAVFPCRVANDENIIMKSEGLQRRSYCYVTDAVSGLFTILSKGKNGEAYNVASSISVTTIRNMAERLVALFPEKGLSVKFELPKDSEKKAFSFISDAVMDTEKLEALGYRPLTPLDEGLKNTVHYYEYVFE